MGSPTDDTRHDHACSNNKEMTEASEFLIFTTFRLDVLHDPAGTKAMLTTQEQPFPFSLHCERLIASALAFGWERVTDRLSGNGGMELLVNSIISSLSLYTSPEAPSKALRVRLTVSRECDIGVEYADLWPIGQQNGLYLPEKLSMHSIDQPSCTIVLDSASTNPSLFTTHKTSIRGHYDRARERADISKTAAHAKEVLLFNDRSEVMEASISTPYFFRGNRWVTPPLSSGGNAGITRRVALRSGLCVEDIIKVDSLRDGETVWISNGVRGFIMSILELGSR